MTMAHGAGGRQTSELIDEVFKAHFANPDLTADDAAVLVPPAGKMAVSTDGFIVSPAFFPGGNIGKLSICGTVKPECVLFPEILRWQEKVRLTVCLSRQPEWVRSRRAFR
mgnify:CR=1 FL=1